MEEPLRSQAESALDALPKAFAEIERMRAVGLRLRQAWRYNENAKVGRLITELLDGGSVHNG